MRKLIFAGLVGILGLLATADTAEARGGFRQRGAGLMAAPWYLYWPYNAHFQTPAPIMGGFAPPPSLPGYYSTPYFPQHPGASSYVPGSPLNAFPYGPQYPGAHGLPAGAVPPGAAPAAPAAPADPLGGGE